MRLEGWELRLARYINDHMYMPFQWGQNDCMLFAAGGVEAVTGVDPGAEFRGTYDDAISAYRIIGGTDKIEEFVNGIMGAPIENLALLGRGDAVMADNDGRPCLGICMGTDSVFPSETGLRSIPTARVIKGWKVGA